MPVMQLTTKASRQVWASPDGQRKIYELEMDYQGKPVKAKTYSDAIATVGWSGEAETYEKAGRNGMETFVKQPPKESGSNYSGSTGRSSGGRPQDTFTMYLSYAKDLAVALIGTKAYTPERLSEIVAAVSLAGEQLYDSRPDSPSRQTEAAPAKPDVVHEVTEAPIDLSLVDQVFSGESVNEEELPWPQIKGEDG